MACDDYEWAEYHHHEDWELHCDGIDDQYRYDVDRRQRGNDLLKLKFVKVVHQRDKAWCIRFKDGRYIKRDEWLPKSQCRIEGDDLMVPRWLVKAKKLEDFVTWNGP